MMTLSSTWITRSPGVKSRGACFISRLVVNVIKFTPSFSALPAFWVKKL